MVTVGPPNIAPPGTPVAAGARSNIEGFFEVTIETYALLVDNNGALNVYSVDRGGVWQHQVISAQRTFPPNTSIAVSQHDIVGWMSGAATTLTSGAGVIQYNPLETVEPLEVTIPCLNGSTIPITVETSNVSYQAMAVGATQSFIQAFQAIAIS